MSDFWAQFRAAVERLRQLFIRQDAAEDRITALEQQIREARGY